MESKFILVDQMEGVWGGNPYARRNEFLVKGGEFLNLTWWGLDTPAKVKEIITKVSWNALVIFEDMGNRVPHIRIFTNLSECIDSDKVAKTIMALANEYSWGGINWEASLPVLKEAIDKNRSNRREQEEKKLKELMSKK